MATLFRRSYESGRASFSAVRELTPDEATGFKASCARLHQFDRTHDLMALVTGNCDEFARTVHDLRQTLNTEKLNAGNQDPKERRRLQRLGVNFLTSVRLYLDHRETLLKRQYGSKSKALTAFTVARHQLYDREPVYRFVYQLRNYVQHCGMPFQMLTMRQRLVQTDAGEAIESSLFVGFARHELLESFRDWKGARSFIENQAEHFEALNLFEQMTGYLWDIERATINALMPLLWADANAVLRIIREGCDNLSFGQVGYIQRRSDVGESDLILITPPLAVLVWLKLVTLVDGPPGMRINEHYMGATSPNVV